MKKKNEKEKYSRFCKISVHVYSSSQHYTDLLYIHLNLTLDFEWDDDFCTALPSFPVLMEANQSVWTHISDTPERPRSSTCF